MIEIDFSPLRGMKFSCIEGCGFCCTFQPELLNSEVKYYQQNSKTKNGIVSGSMGDPASKEKHSFSLQNKIGGCIFLEKRRCKIYDIRPMYCKIFPINIFFSWRIQLNVNMSCRGLWDRNKSYDLCSLGKEAFSNIPINLKREMFYKSKKIYDNLPNDLKAYIPPHQLRERILEYIGNIKIEQNEEYEYSKHIFKEQLSQKNFNYLPIYVTDDLRWITLKFDNGSIQRIQSEENGNIEIIDGIKYSDICFKTISPRAQDLIKDYLIKIVGRDNFIGSVYLLALQRQTEPLTDLAIKYLNLISNLSVLRLNMLSEFSRTTIIDEKIVKEGIICFDSSIITLPTLGNSL